jgi:hypothetical protein
MRMQGYLQSALWSAYNYCKAYGKTSGLWDSKRVDRALGYLMDGSAAAKWAEYETTIDTCFCPDSTIRKATCKHSLSLMISKKYEQICEAEGWTP